MISTLPVWSVLNVVPEWELPDWYTGQIRYLAQDRYRVSWLNLYLATEEPVTMFDERELSTWLATPHSPTPGYMYDQAAMDPDERARGHAPLLHGRCLPRRQHGRDTPLPARHVRALRAGIIEMYPGLRQVRVAAARPRVRPVLRRVPEAHTWWASTARTGERPTSTVCTSPARPSAAGASAPTVPPAPPLTCVEDYLGRRLATFGDGWRY